MESIKRTLMLLKPVDSRLIEPGKSGGTLKAQSSAEGLSISLKTDCLKDGDYSLYLFLPNGKDLFAGDIKGGALSAMLKNLRIEDIKGAAVVCSGSDGNPVFVLKSSGVNWTRVVERFRMTRTAGPALNVPQYTAADANAMESIEQKSDLISEGMQHDAPFETTIAGYEDSGCEACPHVIRQTKVNPFDVFPGSEWVKISYPGPSGWWHYISGNIYKDGAVAAKVLGVPGEYGMAPPIWLEGFGTYMRCITDDAKGYWLMFQDAVTGEVLDMDLSPRGE